MSNEKVTIREATRSWVETFNAIPTSLIEKLQNIDEVTEITPLSKGDRVYINGLTCEGDGEDGEIVKIIDEHFGETRYLVDVDGIGKIDVPSSMLDPIRDDYLPMWGTMWTCNDSIDDEWLERDGNLQKMADCGFRIYEQEDLGYIFGIDGAGYDFYQEHWIPLYKARGLKWHDLDDE